MGFRLGARGGAAIAIAAGWVHCASLSGLDQYTPCDSCGRADVQTGTGSSSGGRPPVDDSPVTTYEPDTAVPDVVEGVLPDDAAGDTYVAPAPDAPDDTGMVDGRADTGVPDSGQVREAGGPGPDGGSRDAAADAPTCDSVSCPHGCCTASGLCAGGGLTATCGSNGAACSNCASYDLVCSAGACVTPVDSGMTGPPACSPSTCGNLCVPYFVQCCKPDQSCGCALLFPPGPCN